MKAKGLKLYFLSFLVIIFTNNADALLPRPLQKSSLLKLLGGSGKSKSPVIVMVDVNRPGSTSEHHHHKDLHQHQESQHQHKSHQHGSHHHHDLQQHNDLAGAKDYKELSSKFVSMLYNILKATPEYPSAKLEETKEYLLLGLQAYGAELEKRHRNHLRSPIRCNCIPKIYPCKCKPEKKKVKCPDSCERKIKPCEESTEIDECKYKKKRGTGKTMPPAPRHSRLYDFK